MTYYIELGRYGIEWERVAAIKEEEADVDALKQRVARMDLYEGKYHARLVHDQEVLCEYVKPYEGVKVDIASENWWQIERVREDYGTPKAKFEAMIRDWLENNPVSPAWYEHG